MRRVSLHGDNAMNEYISQILKLVEQGKISAAEAQSLIDSISHAESKTDERRAPEQPAPEPKEEEPKSQATSEEQAAKDEVKFPFDWNKPITIELPPIAEKLGKEIKDLDASAILNKAKQEVQHFWEKILDKDVVTTNTEQTPPHENASQADAKTEESGSERSEGSDK